MLDKTDGAKEEEAEAKIKCDLDWLKAANRTSAGK